MSENHVLLESVLKCPECGHTKQEIMPTDACLWFYECERAERSSTLLGRGRLAVLASAAKARAHSFLPPWRSAVSVIRMSAYHAQFSPSDSSCRRSRVPMSNCDE